MDWTVEHRRGSAQALHDAAADRAGDPERRTVVVQEVSGPAVVLGSTQPIDAVDASVARARGVEVARRRSGGGAVLLGRGDHVWVDVVVPVGDPLWDDDVGRASWWLGEAWVRALGGGAVHRSGVSDRAAARVACFAAVGPGEVSADGVKLVGISQRRTRTGARFQCVAYREWRPERLLELLGPSTGDPGPRAAVEDALRRRAGAALGPGWSVVEDLLPTLP